MKIKKLKINTKSQKYSILIGKNLLSNISKLVLLNSIKFKQCLLVIDKKVPNYLVLKIQKSFKNKKISKFFLEANEKNKNQRTVEKILNILLKKNFSRDDCLITIGGGITGDVGGFAASLFKRGLSFINIPTTLLSQVDSSIGGKTGVNTPFGKNLIGSFYQPKLVISDINFLRSLPKRELICGYGEILKHSLILNKNFFRYLNKNFPKILNLKSPFIDKAIYESCKIKKIVVEKDEKEMGLRKMLNFGHTFAHAFEATLNFSKKLNHGEAVILGMKSAIKFSLLKNFINKKEYDLIFNHLENEKFPRSIKNYFKLKDLNMIISFMIKDKKNNSDKIKLMLIKKIGSPIIDREYSKKNLNLFLKKELTN